MDMDKFFKDASDNGWVAKHREVYLQDGEAGYMFDGTSIGGLPPGPTLLLFTTGRISGKPSIMPVGFKEIDGAYVIVGSKAGSKKHPDWYYNLMAQGSVKLKVKNNEFEATTRIAEGEEREKLWVQLVEQTPAYVDCQVAAGDRQIPVVICEPI